MLIYLHLNNNLIGALNVRFSVKNLKNVGPMVYYLVNNRNMVLYKPFKGNYNFDWKLVFAELIHNGFSDDESDCWIEEEMYKMYKDGSLHPAMVLSKTIPWNKPGLYITNSDGVWLYLVTDYCHPPFYSFQAE